MEEQQHKKTADQLIHDNSFIIWCLCPTKESDKQWIENYLSVYPEEAETLKQAKEKDLSTQIQPYTTFSYGKNCTEKQNFK